MDQRAGSARLLRTINESAAFGHLLDRGRLTRADLGKLTGLTKPTTSDVLRRLGEAGLAVLIGRTTGGPGPNAEVYGVNPDAAYLAAISVRARDNSLTTAIADLTGTIRARRESRHDPETGDPVRAVATAVQAACRQAHLPVRRLDHVRIGVPGSYDEGVDAIRFVDVPGWSRPGLVAGLSARLHTEVSVDNDANLAAVAERRHGVAEGADGFALLWLGEDGLGLAIDLGGALLRGGRGGAGEIGYMPVGLPDATGSAVPRDFHDLVSGGAIRDLAREYGITAGTGREAVALARTEYVAALPGGAEQAGELLRDLATRVAIGLAAVIAVVDPPLIVLSGEVGQAGGAPLAEAVMAALDELTVLRATVVATSVADDPVLLGALESGLATVRAGLFGRHADRVPGNREAP